MQRSVAGATERDSSRANEPAGRVGVIDLGSNTARLEIFRTSAAGAVRAIDQRKEVPRLGLKTLPDGSLAPEAIQRGVAALQRFAALLREMGSPRTLAVTTSAVREAPNAPEFLSQVQRSSGLSLRVLSGLEEARYAYLGVASAWELGTALVCDLGGGSLQIVEVRDDRLHNSVSLPLGGLRLTQRFLEHDPPKSHELDELRQAVRKAIDGALEAFGGRRYQIFGVGGTVRALARASIDLRGYPIARVHGFPLRDRDLSAIFELLVDAPASKRNGIVRIGSDRADVILAGLIVFEEIVRAADAGWITVSGTGIREGIALEVAGAELPAPAAQLAYRSVAAAAEGISFSLEHGERIAKVAGALFDLVAEGRNWGDGERLALTVGAWMHDAGVAIDLWRHARHSAYLLRSYPLWGLDQRQGLLASMAAFLHEGDDPPSSWRKEFLPILKPSDLELALGLGAILQVAERLAAAEPRFALTNEGTTLSIELGDARAPGLGTKATEKIRKPLSEALGLEVRFRDT